MLTVRIQAIDGARTFTSQDSQPCRLLPPVYASPCTSRHTEQNSGPSGSLLLPRKDFPPSASCRFIPAHQTSDFWEVCDLSGHSMKPQTSHREVCASPESNPRSYGSTVKSPRNLPELHRSVHPRLGRYTTKWIVPRSVARL